MSLRAEKRERLSVKLKRNVLLSSSQYLATIGVYIVAFSQNCGSCGCIFRRPTTVLCNE